MYAEVLKSARMSLTPLTVAVREALATYSVDVTEVAAITGMKRSTLNARLTKQNPLDPLNPHDVELVGRIAKAIGADPGDILKRAEQLARGGPRDNSGPDIDAVIVLLDTLESSNAESESKARARRALMRMLGVEP